MTPDSYPLAPGFKDSGSTSQQAAQATTSSAEYLRRRVLDRIRQSPCTADECASALDESILSVRPRVSELRALAKITDSGLRRKNQSGHTAIVWRTADPPKQSDLFQ
jgi:hypothetical protein